MHCHGLKFKSFMSENGSAIFTSSRKPTGTTWIFKSRAFFMNGPIFSIPSASEMIAAVRSVTMLPTLPSIFVIANVISRLDSFNLPSTKNSKPRSRVPMLYESHNITNRTHQTIAFRKPNLRFNKVRWQYDCSSFWFEFRFQERSFNLLWYFHSSPLREAHPVGALGIA